MNIQSREPNGRRSRLNKEVETSPAEIKRLRDAALAGMRSPEWGTELGRLFLEGKVTAELYGTGKRWAELAADYERVVTGGKLAIRGFSLQGEGGHAPDPDTEAGQRVTRKERSIIEAMYWAGEALEGAGPDAEASVKRVCEKDLAVDYMGVRFLVRGLEALCLHWTLTAPSKRASHVR